LGDNATAALVRQAKAASLPGTSRPASGYWSGRLKNGTSMRKSGPGVPTSTPASWQSR